MAREFVYIPGQGAATHWHLYEIAKAQDDGQPRRLEQRRLLDLTRERPWPLLLPEAEVLKAETEETVHFIEPLAIPSNGVEVERRWQLARYGRPAGAVDTAPATVADVAAARRLRFDVMVEALEK